MVKYKEAYNHATSIIAELERENRKLKQLVAIAIAQRFDFHPFSAKGLVKDGENFSHWVRMQLRKHQPGVSEPKVKPAPPRNYMCKNCFGNHWTADCPTLEASE